MEVVTGPVAFGDVFQQFHGLGRFQRPNGEAARPFSGHQPGQSVSAGDQDRAGGVAGEQGAHLRGGGGVVEQDESAPVGQKRPKEGGTAIDVRGNGVGRNVQGTEEAVQYLVGFDTRSRTVSAQIDVELSVGEVLSDPVRPAQGQGGLTYPGGPGDDVDR